MKNLPKELVEASANAIMKGFIPKGESAQEFSFHFTIPPSYNFKAVYQKDTTGHWELASCEAATD